MNQYVDISVRTCLHNFILNVLCTHTGSGLDGGLSPGPITEELAPAEHFGYLQMSLSPVGRCRN